MNATDTTIYVEPSNRTLVVDWTPGRIRMAEIAADGGDLRLAGELCDALLADDAVQAVIDNRANALLGCDLAFEEGRGRRKKAAVKALEGEEDFYVAYPNEALVGLLMWSFLLNVAPGLQRWTEQPSGRVVPITESWHPRWLRQDPITRQWKIRVNDGAQEIGFTPGDGTWLLHTPRGRSRPWMLGAWRAVSRWWLLKHYAKLDWGRYSDRQGQGLFVGSAPAEVKKENRQALAKDLQQLGRTAGIALPPGYDIKLVESTAKTWETFQAQIAAADKGITVALTGLNLTNEQGGSYAKAESLGGIRSEIITGDGEALATTLHDQSLVYWAEFNFASRKLAAWPTWNTTPPEDTKATADVSKTRADAATSLAKIGIFTVNEVRQAAGFDPLEDGGDELVKVTDGGVPPAPPVADDAPTTKDLAIEIGKVRFELGENARAADVATSAVEAIEKTLADFGRTAQMRDNELRDAVNTQVDAYNVLAKAQHDLTVGLADAGVAIGNIADTVEAVRSDVDELRTKVTTADEAIDMLKTRSGLLLRVTSGIVQGQLYADTVADNGRERAAAALAPDVEAVLAAVNDGESYTNIRERIVKAFKGMSPIDVARVLEASMTMAELGGRKSVNEDDVSEEKSDGG